MTADLHLHTFFSDGTYSPEELSRQAALHGFAAIALTDHDSVEGCDRAAQACREAGIEFLAGVELTAEHEGIEIHILGYLLNTQDPQLLSELSKFQGVRQNRIREMVARLNDLQVNLSADTVFELANCRAPGRPHVARALVNGGHCESMDEAFDRFLKKNRPAWVPKFKMSAAEAIHLIHTAAGVAIMAHPGLNHADHAIAPMVEAGLDGLECFHSKHSTSTSEYYLELADRFQLLVTGGSDCHGYSKGRPLMGTIKLPYQHVERLKARASRYRSMTETPLRRPAA